METTAAMTTGVFANTTVIQEGKPQSASDAWVTPAPRATAIPTIKPLLTDRPVLNIMRIPVTVMAANTVRVAPPSTHWGTLVRKAENFGSIPAIPNIMAARAATQRFTTLVVVTIPTFWLKVTLGSPPKKAPMILLSPNPRIPPRSSLSVASLSIPPMVVAVTSPMACRELMANSRPIATQDETSNSIPKCIIFGRANMPARPTALKSTIPNPRATPYPTIMPISTEASFMIPLP